MEAAHDEPVAVSIQQGERKALVAAGVLEWVEANQADPPERPANVLLNDRRPRLDCINIPDDLTDTLDVATEDRLKRLSVAAGSQAHEPARKTARPPDQANNGKHQGKHNDEQCAHDCADVWGNKRVEIDRTSSWAVTRV